MSVLEQVAPRLAKAHRERRVEIRRRRPCGRDGYCTACYLADELASGRVAWTRYEPTPWLYHRDDPRYARDWSYTLWQYHGGFRTRVYDWELEHPDSGKDGRMRDTDSEGALSLLDKVTMLEEQIKNG